MTNTNQQEQLYGVGSFNHRFKAKKQGIDEWVTGSLIERTLRYGFRYSILVLGDVEDNIEDEEIIIDYPTLQPVKTFETPVEDGKQGGEVKTDKIKLKLEYKVIHIDGSDEYGKRQSYSKEAELLNDMGNEGWELVSVTASSINYNVYYYFKQSKT